MIISADTFEYFTVVTDGQEDQLATWPLQPAEHTDRAREMAMPFGREPALSISEADPPTNACAERPWVLRSRFMLRSTDRNACFHVDRSLTAALRAGDVIHIARTERGGLGLSVLRNQRLVVAAGAITAAPLGEDVGARIAPERWDEAIAQLRPPLGVRSWNPRKLYRDEWPVEIRIDGTTRLFFSANREINGFHLFTVHGFYVRPSESRLRLWAQVSSKPKSVQGVAGKDECIALSRTGQCSTIGANASAFLLATDGLEVVGGGCRNELH